MYLDTIGGVKIIKKKAWVILCNCRDNCEQTDR